MKRFQSSMNARSMLGVTLLEVLIALIVFSIGLIGVAGILVISLKSNQVAYQRTQAIFIAHSMMDRIRRNNLGLWGGDYDAMTCPAPSAPLPAAPACTLATPCRPAEDFGAGGGLLAAWDRAAFCASIRSSLPAGTGSVTCTQRGTIGAPTPTIEEVTRVRLPYDGTCIFTLTWTEQAQDGEGGADIVTGTRSQSFTWVIQP